MYWRIINIKDIWSPIWGDGNRVGSEQWDDGNLVNDDGCSSECLIESKFACTGGSLNTKDTWKAICSKSSHVVFDKSILKNFSESFT